MRLLLGGRRYTYIMAQVRGDPVEGGLSEMGPVHPIGPPVPALLSGIPMRSTLHARTPTRARTQTSYKVYIIPKPGFLFIPVVAITATVDIRVGKASHEGTILQKPRLGILNKPNAGVIIINDFPAPQN